MLCEELELRELLREGEVVVLRLLPLLPRGVLVALREERDVLREVPAPALCELREVEGSAVPREGARPVVTDPDRLLPRDVTPRGATYELPRRVVLLKFPVVEPPRREPWASAPPPTCPNELPRRPPQPYEGCPG